ncbi:Uncharacterised protein [Chlamydia abortus]|nr:Uncharacterised protein [Chlamydia abortus]
MGYPAYSGIARVQIKIGAGCCRQRKIAAVIIAHPISELPIAGGATELLDPRMLIRGNRLACQLTSDPIRFLGHEHLFAHLGTSQGSRASPRSTSNNNNICMQLFHHPPGSFPIS